MYDRFTAGVHFSYDATTGQWRRIHTEHSIAPDTKRACECGVWATGGLCSDWCPLAGGDCVQAESR